MGGEEREQEEGGLRPSVVYSLVSSAFLRTLEPQKRAEPVATVKNVWGAAPGSKELPRVARESDPLPRSLWDAGWGPVSEGVPARARDPLPARARVGGRSWGGPRWPRRAEPAPRAEPSHFPALLSGRGPRAGGGAAETRRNSSGRAGAAPWPCPGGSWWPARSASGQVGAPRAAAPGPSASRATPARIWGPPEPGVPPQQGRVQAPGGRGRSCPRACPGVAAGARSAEAAVHLREPQGPGWARSGGRPLAMGGHWAWPPPHLLINAIIRSRWGPPPSNALGAAGSWAWDGAGRQRLRGVGPTFPSARPAVPIVNNEDLWAARGVPTWGRASPPRYRIPPPCLGSRGPRARQVLGAAGGRGGVGGGVIAGAQVKSGPWARSGVRGRAWPCPAAGGFAGPGSARGRKRALRSPPCPAPSWAEPLPIPRGGILLLRVYE